MKNRIRIITVLALIFVASYSLRAQRYGSYSIDRLEREVYYEGMCVRGADASTFEDLGYGYGKDRRHVYRYGEVLEYVMAGMVAVMTTEGMTTAAITRTTSMYSSEAVR